MSTVVRLSELGKSLGIQILTGDRTELPATPLHPDEKKAIERALDFIKRTYARVSPKLAELFESQKEFIIRMAEVYKYEALKASVAANFAWPPKLDSLSVAPIAPQFIRYVATPSASDPAYSDYELNTFILNFANAGEAKHILGSDTNYWRGLSQTRGPIMLVFLQDGLIEIGTAPRIVQLYIEFEGYNMYGALFEPDVVKLPIEATKPVYQYSVPAFIADADRGTKYVALAEVAGKSRTLPVGVAFYYVDKFKGLVWIS